MEMLDLDACQRVSENLGGVPIFASDRYDMYEIVSLLRSCHRMLSSRYHAIVTTMSAGVPSAGVTMDERIRNLMRDRGHEHLLMRVDELELEDKIVAALCALDSQTGAIRDAMGRTVARNLRLMARMGMYLEEQVARHCPEFPVRTGVLGWEDYLPPLSRGLTKLVEQHGDVLVHQ
jgi:polysaccharide pyruvyl transferase WcaK-like protein